MSFTGLCVDVDIEWPSTAVKNSRGPLKIHETARPTAERICRVRSAPTRRQRLRIYGNPIMPEVIINGPEGRLEGRYHHSQETNAPIALFLHPHPQHGGTMSNKVVYTRFTRVS